MSALRDRWDHASEGAHVAVLLALLVLAGLAAAWLEGRTL